MRWVRVGAVAVLIIALLPAIAGAGSSGGTAGETPPSNPVADEARARHQAAVDFWTHARVAQARPRVMTLDDPPKRGSGLSVEGVTFAPVHHAPGHCGGPPGAPRDCPGDTTTTTTSTTTTTTTSTTTTTTTTIPGDDTITVVTGARWTKGGDIADASGKVLFALGSSYYVCSASVVDDSGQSDRSIVVTAAHCMYDETSNAFATHWVFIPNYDADPAPLSTSNDSYCADTQHGCWSASALFVHSGYADQPSFNTAATRYDFGFAAVLEPGGNSNQHLDAVVPSLGIQFTAVATNNSVQGWAFGYPAAGKYNGRQLIHCGNGVTTDPLNQHTTYRLAQCDMTGGSSGGPWLRSMTAVHNGTVFSVNSYGYRNVRAMHGPMFNANTLAVYTAALNGSTDTIVTGTSG